MEIKPNIIDRVVGYFSPAKKYDRFMFRQAYHILETNPINRNLDKLYGKGDSSLNNTNLSKLRGVSRSQFRNNPIAKGILKTEANGVVGSETAIQAKTEDEDWNSNAEDLWRQEMLESSCDSTNKFNFHTILHKLYRTYRLDGDVFVLFTKDGLQVVEGDCVGTPNGYTSDKWNVNQGIVSKKGSDRFIGIFAGKYSKYGYIKKDSYHKIAASNCHHIYNPERFSNSRGEPVLAGCAGYLDKLVDYLDAEAVAARVNACMSAFISSAGKSLMPPAYKGGNFPSGIQDGLAPENGGKSRPQHMSPGQILYGGKDDKMTIPGAARPCSSFDKYVLRMMGIIGRPLCMPMALVSLDFHGITNVNSRLIFSEVRDNWKNEQEFVVRPFVRRVWNSKIDEWIFRGLLADRPDKYRSVIYLKRWPYVDPYKEANADRLQLESGTTTRTDICARQGRDVKEVDKQRKLDDDRLKDLGIKLKPEAKGGTIDLDAVKEVIQEIEQEENPSK